MQRSEIKKTNPLAAYGVTDEEFAFYEKLYRTEQRAYWKGVLIGFLFTMAGYILIAIIV